MDQGGKGPRKPAARTRRGGGARGPVAAASRRHLERHLAEARAQQAAMAGILRVIASSPTDVQPVFDAIVQRATRLCGAAFATAFRFDGQLMTLAAHHGMTAAELDAARQHYPRPAARESASGRAIAERRVVHIRDVRDDPEYGLASVQETLGFRTVLAVPMLRDGDPIGSLSLWRRRVRPFTPAQIALMTAFAQQAVIAVENVRLHTERLARNAALAEALDRQTATTEVLRVISRSAFELEPVLAVLAENATRLCAADWALVYRADGDVLRVVASHGAPAELRDWFAQGGQGAELRPGRGSVTGRAAAERRTVHVPDVLADPEYEPRAAQRQGGWRAALGVPMLRDGRLVGVFFLSRAAARPFTDDQIELVTTFADQAAIAIENVRLVQDLQGRNRELREALEQQTATAEILGVISGAPADLAPVLDAVVRNAARLCDASDAEVFQVEGTSLRLAAKHGPSPLFAIGEGHAISRDWVTGRAVVDRDIVHVPDLVAAGAEFPEGSGYAERYGHRTTLAAPLLREGVAIGAILIRRTRVEPFSPRQIALLRTFADQAVIAIENVRLFTELQGRNRDLTEALEQQTATAEILRAISGSPTELQPVLETVARAAARFCGASDVAIFRLDGALLRGAAAVGQFRDAVVASFGRIEALEVPVTRGTVTGRAVLEQRLVHVRDLAVEAAEEFPEAQDLQRRLGNRTLVAAPMLREGTALGAIALFRMTVEPFSDKQLELLRLFADQAVIAIENVRLFTELQGRNRDLTEALEQQTATAEILRAISGSPTELQPVLETVARAAARFCGASDVVIVRLDGTTLRGAAAVGRFRDILVGALGTLAALEVPANRGTVTGRAVVERRLVHVRDLAAESDEFPEGGDLQRRFGHRTMVAAPLLREGTPLGAIALFRMTVEPFSDKQLELLRLFADQAVIAIENVRLFAELQGRNRDLTEALEQQTATAEILRVISRSPTDVQPVFDTIAQSAARLCEAQFCHVFRFDGERLHFVAHHGLTPEGQAALARAFPRPPDRGSAAGRAVLGAAVAHIPDVNADAEYEFGAVAKVATYGSVVAVPMLREGVAIGTINVARLEPGPFTERQLALLRTFADQAVIAIENVRLFTELETKNRDLTESLEQQTATGEILRVISSSPTDVQPVFDLVARHAVRLCEADISVVSRFDGTLLQLAAVHGVTQQGVDAVRAVFPMETDAEALTARAFRSRAVVHEGDLLHDPLYALKETARAVGWRGGLSVPMLREGRVIGVIFVGRSRPGFFTEPQLALLKTFAEQAVIAIENVRLFTELEARNRDLTETLDQQTATSQILQVISQSPTAVQPVFRTIAEHARRLCDADISVISRFDGALLQLEEVHGLADAGVEAIRRVFPMTPAAETVSARTFRERAVVHVEDVLADARYETKDAALIARYRGCLGVPMVREGQVVGVIFVARYRAGLFSDTQVGLLRTFADQAVIAIENVRLFTELAARNRDLTEALEQQTATSEVLKIISRSAFDLQPVLETLIEHATRLGSADGGVIYRFDGDLQRLAAAYGISAELRAYVERNPLRPGRGTAVGRALLESRAVHIHDVQADPEYTYAGAGLGAYRTILGIPMLREGRAVGVFSVWRSEVRPFTAKQIELVTTFADQGAIAIENVRLFQELEARNRDLTETLEQQTATSEILRVISSSPTDIQPVLDAVAENAARLCDANDVAIFRVDGDRLRLAASRGPLPYFAVGESRRIGRDWVTGRAVVDGTTVHVEDLSTAAAEFPEGSAHARQFGHRTTLATPLLREGVAIGAILIRRLEVRSFTPKEIGLLRTFADQAVIAIENVRLFQELEARTRELTRSVEELRALGEVSQAVGSTLDLETVLATIVTRAVQLSGSHSGLAYEFDETARVFHVRATHQITPEHLAAVRAAPIRLGEGAVGTAGVTGAPVEIADIEDEHQLVAPQARGLLVQQGMGSLLAVPLVREGRLLGGLVIIRRERGAFSPDVVALLRTFAAQSVLAIHNARLFREVQRQKQYSDALVETSPVAIATMDLAGAVVGWNPGAERLFGYPPAEALGRRMEELVATPELRDEIRANIRQTLEGGGVRAISRRARKDGTLVDVEISSMPVVVDGVRVGMIGIYHDITELLRARRDAEAANEAKSAFLATMSHEIRTPMNAVIGMTGLLLNTELTETQREYAEIVRQSGDALLTVINDILDFSKIEAGKLELESQPFDLRECVEGALDLIAARAAEKGLDLAYLIAEGTPAAIVGDVTRLRQILLNLLSNAVKFTERGEIVLTVSARPLAGPGATHELAFSVRDTGIGIPPDRVDRLFQSFSQVDASTTRRYGGTGLGLAISRRLTELMGGRIEVTSEVGVGTEFRVTIRVMDAPPPARRDLSGVEPTLRGKRVLVVDDNATNRRILASHLDTWGMATRATPSPAEALEWIRRGEAFDLGILDMHMPEMDGVTLARAIREHAAGTLPLVLFTSLGRREARVESQGFAAYLHKPIKPSQLFDTLIAILAERVRVAEPGASRHELDPGMGRRHPLRILLAEDNVVNQKVALRLLGQLGYRADLAANGLEAIDAVARQAYDVVLMDVQMPELDGFEASREINRRWPGERRPRIVAMTANAMQGDRERCVAAGMDDYVSKPIRVEELVAALERCRWRPDGPARAVPAGRAAAAGAPELAGVERVRASARGTQAAAAAGAVPEAPDPAAPPGEPPGIDGAAVDRVIATMGATFAAELIDTFLEDGRALAVALAEALARGDVDAFRRAAHSLKSNAETLGATRLGALARELEALARSGTLAGAEERLGPLARAHEAAARALQEVRRGLPA